MTQLHGVVYVVCQQSSTILRFNTATRQRLTDIEVSGLAWPLDLAACEGTSRVYVADIGSIWRASADDADIKRWLPKSTSCTFTPSALSVRSTRLLVTSRYTHQLIQFDAVGDELSRVQLPDDVEPWHSVESPAGTFVVSLYNSRLEVRQVVEVNHIGEMLHQFGGSRSLGYAPHVAVDVDSQSNIFVSDARSSRILLHDNRLRLRRVIVDEYQLNHMRPLRLCYIERSRQLLVGFNNASFAVFDVLR